MLRNLYLMIAIFAVALPSYANPSIEVGERIRVKPELPEIKPSSSLEIKPEVQQIVQTILPAIRPNISSVELQELDKQVQLDVEEITSGKASNYTRYHYSRSRSSRSYR